MPETPEKNGFIKRLFTPGTVECAIGCGVLGIIVALLLLWIGVWRTLLIVVLVAIGVFIGGVKDKRAFLSKLLNKPNDHY